MLCRGVSDTERFQYIENSAHSLPPSCLRFKDEIRCRTVVGIYVIEGIRNVLKILQLYLYGYILHYFYFGHLSVSQIVFL